LIGISKLYCGTVEASDPLRYSRMSSELPSHLLQFSQDKKPVVVWNITSRCNLKCVHCYASAEGESAELTTKQGLNLISGLKDFGVPMEKLGIPASQYAKEYTDKGIIELMKGDVS